MRKGTSRFTPCNCFAIKKKAASKEEAACNSKTLLPCTASHRYGEVWISLLHFQKSLAPKTLWSRVSGGDCPMANRTIKYHPGVFHPSDTPSLC